MAIVQIDRDHVVQRCDACAFEREIGFDIIEVGVVPDADGHLDVDGVDRADPVIALPSCNRCGTVELIRWPDADRRGGDGDDLARLWERLGGEPLEASVFEHERSTEDISIDDASAD